MKLLITTLSALTMALPAMASGPGESHAGKGTAYLGNGVLSYEVFEASITHADMENCPVEFDPDAVFCRLTLANDSAHVFVFSYDGAQPLLAVKHYELDGDFLPF
ncbi:hypothetical protein QO034_07060 [Sedimentitalea sp. JM2-8]|uniref:Uncharacterized protein n=1 Tax=Sedimentitalea xiamensis TaxID=3050037 RepID=A0ABT7FCL6_9RHOB|nr:hypothetical protein [Sedimentitalea xiamensis]MDK3072864.1 hypothetical protein [Sedimentitalea xiamensis]